MKVVLEYQGNRYESAENTGHTADEVAEMFSAKFSLMDKFKMELKDGGSLLIGNKAIQSAVLTFLP